jgi:hypothetical protein
MLDMVEEVASGSLNPALRPVLASALAKAKKRNAVVLVSKLDWLSRDVHAISGLMAGPVRFVVAELGIDVDPFALHIFAVFAEKERRMIGQRTSAALERKMIFGWKAGNPDLVKHLPTSNAINASKAEEFAKSVVPSIGAWSCRHESPRHRHNELNTNGMPTARGGAGINASVGNILKRASGGKMKIRNSIQRSAYAARRASLAVDRLLAAASRAERNKASLWAKAWGMRAGLLR